MRRRIDTYTIDTAANAIVLSEETITLEDIRLIVDETQKKIICSSMQKNNMVIKIDGVKTTIPVPVTISSDGKTITIDTQVCTLASGDAITFEIDTADTLSDVTSSISTAITSAQSALLGDDHTATQTAILQAVSTAVQDAAEMNKQAYSARFEQNTDTDNSYTLVLPLIAGVDETTQTATL